MKNNKIILLIAILFFACINSSFSQKKYALLIGIDEYIPEGKSAVKNFRLGNLDGCINDVEAINEILITKFGFKNTEIKILLNANAGRDSIINNFKNLANTAKKGDNVFIFYAGHGSQVTNSLSDETDKKDETIVPADAYLGIPDIRDKEVAVLLDNIVNNGIILTAIFDCCHSGSMARGLFDTKQDKLRWCAPDLKNDSKDGSVSPRPEDKGALIISAAQDDEPASEFRMNNNTPHGAFTYGFIQAMNSLPATASAEQIFLSIRSILKYNNKKQEPVIAGINSRLQSNLLGIPNANIPKQSLIALINPISETEILLQAGYVSGIDVGYTLIHYTNKDTIIVEITEVQSANKSSAKIISGNFSSLKSGDMFEVYTTITHTNSVLSIFLPDTISYHTLFPTMETFFNQLSAYPDLKIVSNPNKESITHSLFYQKGHWILMDSKSVVQDIGSILTANKVNKLINGKASIYLSIPLFSEVYLEFIKTFKDDKRIKINKNCNESDYVFNGRWNNNSIEYGLINPIIDEISKNTRLILPSYTDYYVMNTNKDVLSKGFSSISELILKISRIKRWLTLQTPTDDGYFPFYLSLKNKSCDTCNVEKTYLGQKYDLLFKFDEKNKDDFDGIKRYVHVFVIDVTGSIQAIYPSSNVENKYPKYDTQGQIVSESIILKNITISEPLGYDTFFMLVTEEPISNFAMLVSQSGVQTRGKGGGLGDLFNDEMSTRGISSNSNSSWYLRKMTIESVKK